MVLFSIVVSMTDCIDHLLEENSVNTNKSLTTQTRKHCRDVTEECRVKAIFEKKNIDADVCEICLQEKIIKPGLTLIHKP